MTGLTYNRTSGAIKRDGAVIGRIEARDGGFVATLYLPDVLPITDPDLTCLLASVRKALSPTSASPGNVSLRETEKIVKKTKKRLARKQKME